MSCSNIGTFTKADTAVEKHGKSKSDLRPKIICITFVRPVNGLKAAVHNSQAPGHRGNCILYCGT